VGRARDIVFSFSVQVGKAEPLAGTKPQIRKPQRRGPSTELNIRCPLRVTDPLFDPLNTNHEGWLVGKLFEYYSWQELSPVFWRWSAKFVLVRSCQARPRLLVTVRTLNTRLPEAKSSSEPLQVTLPLLDLDDLSAYGEAPYRTVSVWFFFFLFFGFSRRIRALLFVCPLQFLFRKTGPASEVHPTGLTPQFRTPGRIGPLLFRRGRYANWNRNLSVEHEPLIFFSPSPLIRAASAKDRSCRRVRCGELQAHLH